MVTEFHVSGVTISPHIPQQPCHMSLWYLGIHETISKPIQAGVAKAEIAKIYIL